MAAARFTSFLVKVASRCNLDCDYCYIYHHADQNWRAMPRLLSEENQAAFSMRLGEYADHVGLSRCLVVFHGGEPLLMGADALARFAHRIRASTSAKVEFGLQTNGVLLTDKALDVLEKADITVSLSIDGPRSANDKHRTSRKGRSSFDATLDAMKRLGARRSIFAGVIAVIDPDTSPDDVFSFFDEHKPPKLDFLLPDAHYLRTPPGRDTDPDLYKRWLLHAFDLWLDRYPHLPVRTFEALLDAVSGLPAGTDAFGFGDVSLVTIETDGSYHNLDVLKITREGATKLGGAVIDTPIAEIAGRADIIAHQGLLQLEGLCAECRSCRVVEICGGGSLPHRYSVDGFNHPTVYCEEMLALIEHARARLNALLEGGYAPLAELPPETDLSTFDEAEVAEPLMDQLLSRARAEFSAELRSAVDRFSLEEMESCMVRERLEILSPAAFEELSLQPGLVAWLHVYLTQVQGKTSYSVDGLPLHASVGYLKSVLDRPAAEGLEIGYNDPWLRLPFGNAIFFEDEKLAAQARPVVREALDIVNSWQPALGAEIVKACRAIQFVRDPLAHPDKIVSFSDNSVPGALYVSVVQGLQLIDPYDLADSLVHEHRHQKLYLLERLAPMVEPTDIVVVSPWREDLRPPSGLLHATFVFVELRRLWAHFRDQGPARLHNRAIHQLHETDEHLAEAFRTLEACPLTKAGRELAAFLKRSHEHDTLM